MNGMETTKDTEGKVVEVWVEGMLAKEISYINGRNGPEAGFTLRVPLHADGMLTLPVMAQGRTMAYLKASGAKRGDWLVVNGAFHDDGTGGHVTAGTVCANTSIGWHDPKR